MLVAFPRARIEPVAMDPARFMALIVSGGVATSVPDASQPTPPTS